MEKGCIIPVLLLARGFLITHTENMQQRKLTRKEKALFVLPFICFAPLVSHLLSQDLLDKKAEQLSTSQTVDCGSDAYNSAYSHFTSDQAHACMAQGIKSGRGFQQRQELQSVIPRFYTGEYKAMAIVCVPDNAKARWSKIGYWQPSYILTYRCDYKLGVRYNEKVNVEDQSECAVVSSNHVFCNGK